MYTSSTFESDLMNSYAWDTAIVFLQTFDDRKEEVKTKTYYSRQTSLNTGDVANTGTNKLTDTTKQDVICNIWDMSSNCVEWTTETTGYSDHPCVTRGGDYYDSRAQTNTSGRYNDYLHFVHDGCSFRPLLIV